MDHIKAAEKARTMEEAQAHALIAIAIELRKFNEHQERSAARERAYY
jgi:hypothetical protein